MRQLTIEQVPAPSSVLSIDNTIIPTIEAYLGAPEKLPMEARGMGNGYKIDEVAASVLHRDGHLELGLLEVTEGWGRYYP